MGKLIFCHVLHPESYRGFHKGRRLPIKKHPVQFNRIRFFVVSIEMNSTVHYINVINFCDLLFFNEKTLFNFIDTDFIFFILFIPFWDFIVIGVRERKQNGMKRRQRITWLEHKQS